LFNNVEVGRHVKIRRAIIDEGLRIPEGTEIGYDSVVDRARGYTVTDSGIVIVTKV
jgi:glucose-1-phosphate adenylyltransferase